MFLTFHVAERTSAPHEHVPQQFQFLKNLRIGSSVDPRRRVSIEPHHGLTDHAHIVFRATPRRSRACLEKCWIAEICDSCKATIQDALANLTSNAAFSSIALALSSESRDLSSERNLTFNAERNRMSSANS